MLNNAMEERELRLLRVGSLMNYYVEESNKWVPIAMTWQDVKWCTKYPVSFCNQHRPIPLTDDLLINNCGMIQNENHFNYKDFRIGLSKVDDCWLLCLDNWLIRPIKYLHEWQDAFEINTCTELKIEINK